MKRGTICWLNLEPASPPEMGKIRPAIIVSNSDQNFFLQSVVVIPLSSQAGEIWPLRVRLEISHGKTSYAILPAIRQASKARIQEVVGIARPGDMERIDEALSCYLND
jgi:mRNA interferase MazF